MCPEVKTLERWISGLMLNPNFFLISRLNMACSPYEFNLQKRQQIGIKDITFKSFQLRSDKAKGTVVIWTCHYMSGESWVTLNYVYTPLNE